VATEQGLQAASFDHAAHAYQKAIGDAMSADSVQRITAGFGDEIGHVRAAEVEQANALGPVGESPRMVRVPPIEPIQDRASISTDGVMIRVRQEGWKEVKVTALSHVEVLSAGERASQRSRRSQDPLVRLQHTSYQAGVWDADTMAQYQYAEGLRRGVPQCPIRTSTNDAACWIDRITTTNFPDIPSIVDWTHANQRVWSVGNEVFGKSTPAAKQWVTSQLDALWDGKALEVAHTIAALNANHDVVRQAQGYFESYHARMNYPVYRAAGYPIGSGAVEGANRSVIQLRMKRPGRGWLRHNAQAMLAALCEFHSNRFELAWKSASIANSTNLR